MNIFYLHHAAPLAAVWHCDSHVVKMVLETAQILSTAHHLHGDPLPNIYRPTHEKHPSVLWAAASKAHYSWTADLGRYLCYEYWKRFGAAQGHRHKCEEMITGPLALPPPKLMDMPWRWEEPPQCMPDECKVPGDAVKAYQKYYREKKASFARWRIGAPPPFMTEEGAPLFRSGQVDKEAAEALGVKI